MPGAKSLSVALVVFLALGPAGALAQDAPLRDRHGDPLPAGAIARFGNLRLRHGDIVGALAFSADGATLASAAQLHDALILWDTTTGRERQRLRADRVYSLHALAFAPRGSLLAAVGAKGIRLWDTATGAELPTLASELRLGNRLTFSADGNRLAASGERDNVVLVWDVPRRTVLLRLVDLGPRATSAALAPDGKALAVASGDGTVRLWDVEARREVRRFGRHLDTVVEVAFALDGKTVASCGGHRDRTIRLWDAARGTEVMRLSWVEETAVQDIAFAPDGRSLAAACSDGTVRLFDLATGRERLRWAADRLLVHALAFSPDGRQLASGGLTGVISLWGPSTGTEHGPSAGRLAPKEAVSFSPDSSRLVARLGMRLRVLDITGREWARLDSPRPYDAVTVGDEMAVLAPDSRRAAQGMWRDGAALYLRPLGRGASPPPTDGAPPTGYPLAFSPDGGLLACSDGKETVLLRDATTLQERGRFGGLRSPRAGCFSLDGRTFVAVSDLNPEGKRQLRAWDVAMGRERWQASPRGAWLSPPAFAADGRTLAFTTRERRGLEWDVAVHVLDLGTGQVTATWPVPDGAQVALSPDGRTVAFPEPDGRLRLWEVGTREPRLSFPGQRDGTTSLEFSPDGRLLVSCHPDLTALVWDLTGRWRDGRFAVRPLSEADREAAWADLAREAARAYRAISTLAGAPPEQVVPFLRERLTMASADADRLAGWVRDLDDDDYATRQAAMNELARQGRRAAPALYAGLAARPSLEARRRIAELLDRLEPARAPDARRLLRALEALEAIGTSEAQEVVRRLADQFPGGWEERAARATRERLERRSSRE